MNTQLETFYYDNKIVRNFAYATILWSLVGFLVGLIAALQLVLPGLNLNEYLSYGRLRPLHTNAAIFAFCGNAIFAGVYYSTQHAFSYFKGSNSIGSFYRISFFYIFGWT